MTKYLQIEIAKEPFYLLPQKALYRPLHRQLVISDVHLGKAAHFRKNGIPLPGESFIRDLDKLHYLLDLFQPETVIFLGDLFHSQLNSEWLWFKSFVHYYEKVQFILVQGNHDILPADSYKLKNLIKVDLLEEQHLIFSHTPGNFSKYTLCGHIHPGIRIQGRARDSITLPTFVHSAIQLILPAFGTLTGLSIQKMDKRNTYFVVTGETVVELAADLSRP